MSNTKTDVTDSLPDGWRVVRLGDVAEVVTGRTPLRSCPDYYGGTTPWVKPTDLAKGNTVSTSEEYLTDDGVAVSRLLPQGSVLVSCIGTIGEVAIAAIPMCTNQQINALVPNEKVVSSFLYWVCTSLSDFLRTSAAKTAVPILNKSSFSKVTIPLPSIEEQHAICRVLNSVDDAIERTDGVIGATEQVRDALLYELLSRGMPGWHREWRDVPGVGTLPASWDVVRFGDVADITKGTSITKSQTIPGDIPVIGGGFVPSYYHNQANRTGETVTVSASGAHAGFVSYHDGPIFASDCSTIKPKNDHISTKFLFRLLKSKQAYIYDRQSGTGQPHIYPKDLQGIRVPLPSSQEQHAICGVLNSVDDSLECLRAERDSMAVLKGSVADGLLTGRVRVPLRD